VDEVSTAAAPSGVSSDAWLFAGAPKLRLNDRRCTLVRCLPFGGRCAAAVAKVFERPAPRNRSRWPAAACVGAR